MQVPSGLRGARRRKAACRGSTFRAPSGRGAIGINRFGGFHVRLALARRDRRIRDRCHSPRSPCRGGRPGAGRGPGRGRRDRDRPDPGAGAGFTGGPSGPGGEAGPARSRSSSARAGSGSAARGGTGKQRRRQNSSGAGRRGDSIREAARGGRRRELPRARLRRRPRAIRPGIRAPARPGSTRPTLVTWAVPPRSRSRGFSSCCSGWPAWQRSRAARCYAGRRRFPPTFGLTSRAFSAVRRAL
jgi:hypothetical protein